MASLSCRAMSQTPTYDQVRGERINADVPASEGDQHEVDYLGKHRLQSDAPVVTAVCGSSPGPGADLVEDWPEITADDSEYVGRHCLRADASAAPESGSAPGPGADLVEDWCWFGTGRQRSAASVDATRPVHSVASAPGPSHTPAANQQAGPDLRRISEQAGDALFRPPAHRRDRQRPGALGASRDAKTGPLETLTVSQSAEHDHDASDRIRYRRRSRQAGAAT